MRDLINKLTLLESGGTLSIPAIANLFARVSDPTKIFFGVEEYVDLPLDLKEETVRIFSFEFFDVFGVDKDGHLKYYHSNITSTSYIRFDSQPQRFLDKDDKILDKDNKKIIGDFAIKKLKQFFGIDMDYDYRTVVYDNNWKLKSVRVNINRNEKFLELLDKAFEYRRASYEDM